MCKEERKMKKEKVIVNRKPRFASQDEAKQYIVKAEKQQHFGLRYWGACDFLGITQEKLTKLGR